MRYAQSVPRTSAGWGPLAAANSSMLRAIGSRLGEPLAVRSVLAAKSCAVRAAGNFPAYMSSQTPPPDAARGATADLFDIVNQGKVQIMNPVFRDFGGHLRFKGQAATVKCFENNPLVRKVWQPSAALPNSLFQQHQPMPHLLTSNYTHTGA